MSTRRNDEKQQRHEAILDAAEQIFSSKGYERCSMQDIAVRANMSRALLYVYFTDKPAIMRGIILRAAHALSACFARAIASSENGLQQVGNIGHAYFQFSQQQPHYFDALTQVSAFVDRNNPDDLTEQMVACSEHIMLQITSGLERGLQDGSLSAERVADPAITAYYLRGSLHGVIMQSRVITPEDRGYPGATAMVEYTLRMHKRALAPD